MVAKSIATIVAWVMYAGIAIASVESGGWAFCVAVAAAMPLFGLMAFIWMDEIDFHEMEFRRHPSTSQADDTHLSERDKRKRETLDAVLRDLSDDQLRMLKQRLANGTIDDDILYKRIELTDDGEIEFKERK